MESLDAASTLYYSDDPETLSTARQGHVDGVLFDFDLVAGAPQRFLFYHVNADVAMRSLAVRFLNQTAGNVMVSYVKSLPAGTPSYIQVGHASTFGFLQGLASGDRRSVQVAPGANEVPEIIPLGQNALAAGLFELSLTVGSVLRCSLVSVTNPADGVAVARTGQTFTLDGVGRRGRFDISNKTPVTITAAAGVPTIVARLGQRLFPNLDKRPDGTVGNALKGEYGVFTAINLTILNTATVAKDVALYQSAHGGASTASYLVDGVPAESGTMLSTSPYPRYKVKCYTVPAGGKMNSQILTMPDSASSSPVVLMLDDDDAALPNPDAPGSIVAYRPITAGVA